MSTPTILVACASCAIIAYIAWRVFNEPEDR